MPQLIPRTFLLLCAIACLCLLTVHLLPADIRPNVAQLILVIIIPPSTVLTILLLAVLWHFFSTHVHGATSLATIDPGPAHGPPVITAVHASSAQTACDGASSAPHAQASLIDLQHILYSALTQTLRCLTTILLSGTWKTSLTLVRTPAPPPIDQSRDRQRCRWHCSPSTSPVATRPRRRRRQHTPRTSLGRACARGAQTSSFAASTTPRRTRTSMSHDAGTSVTESCR
jgi:hypothetical protein